MIISITVIAVIAPAIMQYFQIPFGTWYFLFVFGTLLGCLLPDIDHEKTMLSKILPKFIHKILKHRKQTHSLLFSLIFAGCFYFINLFFALGIFFGCLLHIAEDAFTKAGIHNFLWYPFKRKRR